MVKRFRRAGDPAAAFPLDTTIAPSTPPSDADDEGVAIDASLAESPDAEAAAAEPMSPTPPAVAEPPSEAELARDRAALNAGWRVIGASVRGTSHETHGTVCQDAHAWRVLGDGTLIAAVADGAGSAAHSEIGSRLAADTVVETLAAVIAEARPITRAAWDELLRASIRRCRDALVAGADEMAIALRDLATTLSVAVVADPFVCVAQVGDGLIVVQEPTGALSIGTHPARGEYANETTFIVEKRLDELIETLGDEAAIAAVVLSTDGLLRLATTVQSYAPHVPFFSPVLGFARAAGDDLWSARTKLASFLSTDRINRRTDDDKTLLIAVRTDVEVGPATLAPESTDTEPAESADVPTEPSPSIPADTPEPPKEPEPASS